MTIALIILVPLILGTVAVLVSARAGVRCRSGNRSRSESRACALASFDHIRMPLESSERGLLHRPCAMLLPCTQRIPAAPCPFRAKITR